MFKKILSIALLASFSFSAHAQKVEVDKGIPQYKKLQGISGTLNSVGSDTLNNLMTFWGESFYKLYPNTKIQIEGKGSATAPPALAQGVAQLGPMSREMKQEEIGEITKKSPDLELVRLDVALDGLAIYVHKDNPLNALSMEQLDGIFSSTLKSGSKSLETWGDLGLNDPEWKSKPIRTYGRNSASGTYSYFKEHALFKGDFKPSVKERPGSSAVIQSVAEDKFAIGYSGIGYSTADVKILKIAAKQGAEAFNPSYANVVNNKYPLSRMLYVYTLKKKGEKLSPLVDEFLKYVLSYQGQEVVLKDGYFPLPKNIVDRNRTKLE